MYLKSIFCTLAVPFIGCSVGFNQVIHLCAEFSMAICSTAAAWVLQ